MKLENIAKHLNTIEAQKTETKALLAEVNKYFTYALVAGGAPRNWNFGRAANDIDIYVLRSKSDTNQQEIDKKIAIGVQKLSEMYGFGENKAATTINSNAYGGMILNSLYDFQVEMGAADYDKEKNLYRKNLQKCQFIIIDDDGSTHDLESFSRRIFSTYDFGICMTSMDSEGRTYSSPLYNEDIQNKTFTCQVKEFKRNNNAGLQKLVERFCKMQNYFPDFRMKLV